MNIQKFALSSLCLASLGLTAVGQQPQTTPIQSEQNSQKPRGEREQASNAHRETIMNSKNHMLAQCLSLENQAEVILAKVAQEKSKNPAVKQFATMMVEDHQSFLGKLQQFAPEASQPGFLKETDSNQSHAQGTQPKQARTSSENRQREPARQPQSSTIRESGDQRNIAQDHVGQTEEMGKLQHELVQQCLADSKAYLNKKEGSEFDQCFVGMQLAKHASMQSKLTVFQRHATGEFKQVIDQGLETTKKHMKHAESLMEQLVSTSPLSERKLQARQN